MIKKYKYLILLFVFFFALRLLWLPENFFFGWEQGRDFLKLKEIVGGDFTLIGPKTDIDGIFHGPLSYYILLPSFILFNGNPYLVLVSLIAVHAVSVIFLFQFAKGLVSKKFAYIAALFYAISYSSIVYNRWQSNPNLVPALSIFILYFLQKTKENKYYLVVASALWAVVFHLQVIAAFILIIPLLYYVLANKLFNARAIAFSIVAASVMLSTYVIFNFRNDNILINSGQAYLSSSEKTQSEFKLDEFYNESVDNLFPENRNVSFSMLSIILLLNLYIAKRSKQARFMLVLYLAAPITFLVLKVSALRHLYILNPVFISLLLANVVNYFISKKYLIVAAIIAGIYAVGNVNGISQRLPDSNRNFIHHAQRTYFADEIKLIDDVYNDANGSKFSYDYYTVPYWQPQAWRYLFMWYGVGKYGYLPEPNRTERYFVLIEPDEGQPEFYKNWYRDLNSKSTLLDEFTSGKLKVEKRQEI